MANSSYRIPSVNRFLYLLIRGLQRESGHRIEPQWYFCSVEQLDRNNLTCGVMSSEILCRRDMAKDTHLVVERVPTTGRHMSNDPRTLTGIFCSLQLLHCKRYDAIWIGPS